MKTINPFKRLNKEDFIPCSLFPASKVCDTSMDIGRATPLYCLDMVAGNRVSLDLSQLTRFQPMIAPVMTNYSIEYGAFFVPYVAFDEFFQSTWFRTHCQNTDVQRKAVLRAREFFNPAIDNSEKVHPWNFSTKRCGDKVAWVGSLYDHLRAPLGLPDWSVDAIYTDGGTLVDDTTEVNSWLDQSISLGTDGQNSFSVKDMFTSAIYGRGILRISTQNLMSPMQLLLGNPDIFPAQLAAKITPLLSKEFSDGDAYSATSPLDDFLNSPADLGKYYLGGRIGRAYTIPHQVVTGGIGSIISENSGTSAPFIMNWNPFSDSDVLSSADVYMKLIYKSWTGKEALGTFSVTSAGVISYTYNATSSYGQTPLQSLISSSYYSQALALIGGTTPIVSMTPELSGEFYGFLSWIVNNYHLLDGNRYWESAKAMLGTSGKIYADGDERDVNGMAENIGWRLRETYTTTSGSIDTEIGQFKTVFASLAYYFFGIDSLSRQTDFVRAYRPYEELLGKNTIVSVQGQYRSYVENLWISTNRNLKWNSVYWLAYQRIFADWFLNEHYTKHEDYLDLVGAAYIAGAQSLQNGDGKTMTDWFTAGDIADGNNPKLMEDPTLSYFADRIAKGECMPVLWSLDCVTNLRQSTSTSSTPIGQSITENFYNRFYARFKDLINRMGPDYRRNARALYGKGPDDASLLRSQVVGYKSFDMQIGDVAQNSESTKDSTLGQFAGYAVSRNRAGSFDWTAQESGVFVVLAWVRPKYTCFADLVPRSLYKSEYMDYLIPQFGGVGYQDFAFKQLNPTDANPDSRLGYEERYSEYMMMDNECSGLMRTSMAYYNSNRIGTPCYTPNTADFYHLLYMDEESDLKRVFVDNFNDPVLVSAYFNGNVTRQLPATIKTEF